MGRFPGIPDRLVLSQTFSLLNNVNPISKNSFFIHSCPARLLACARPFSTTPPPPPPSPAFNVRMTQVSKDGSSSDADFSLDDLLTTLRREKLPLPPRDLKIFFRSNLEAAASTCVMPRPKAKCFLLELEHIKLICLSDKCLVLHPDQPVIR